MLLIHCFASPSCVNPSHELYIRRVSTPMLVGSAPEAHGDSSSDVVREMNENELTDKLRTRSCTLRTEVLSQRLTGLRDIDLFSCSVAWHKNHQTAQTSVLLTFRQTVASYIEHRHHERHL